MEKSYKLKITPAMLKILGPNMYKNVYFILGELIANSWDADAKNVYIKINESEFIVEDDGNGMSWSEGEIDNYLIVGKETRVNYATSLTKNLKRKKMGRKGLGKLAALSLADPVRVMTLKNNEKSGFILTKEINEEGELKGIDESDINFNYISDSGTSIVMENPAYIGHKDPQTIAKNLSRIFPFTNDDFTIHVIKNNKKPVVIKNSKKTLVKELSTIIVLGEDFKEYGKYVDPKYLRSIKERVVSLTLKDRDNKKVVKDLIIKGWIGTYKTTTNRKGDISDFQDNFISLYSNGKIGEFNILENIGRNSLSESYVVGELHVDLFEDSNLPDMATSNREGYITSDERYQETLKQARMLLDEIIKLRKSYTDGKKKNKIKTERQKKLEKNLIKKTESYKKQIINTVASSLKENHIPQHLQSEVLKKTSLTIEDNLKLLDLKSKIDSNKKKIFISHSSKDKFYVDLIYGMLLFNNFSENEILYSSSDNENSRIPQNESLFGYLRDFFVNSISNEKIHIVYVTSKNMHDSWYAATEVGAGWITKSRHDVFNVGNEMCEPKNPLNIECTWSQAKLDYDNQTVIMDTVQVDDFCVRIEKIVRKCGHNPNSREKNRAWLERQITLS